MTAFQAKAWLPVMTLQQARYAMESSRPFTITMADGKSHRVPYRVPHRDYIMLIPKGSVVLVHGEHAATVLPLRTMTGISHEAEPTAHAAEDEA